MKMALFITRERELPLLSTSQRTTYYYKRGCEIILDVFHSKLICLVIPQFNRCVNEPPRLQTAATDGTVCAKDFECYINHNF